MRVKVNPEIALVAVIDTGETTCRVTFGHNNSSDFQDCSANKIHRIKERQKREGYIINQCYPTVRKIKQLIFTAQQRCRNVKVQRTTFAKLRKLIESEDEAAAIVNCGGIGMLSNAMMIHSEKPLVQAEAVATLAELAWADSSLCGKTVKAGCISIVLAAMERHYAHATLQQMAIGYFRSLSYDGKCCRSMNKFNTVDAVILSMCKNPKMVEIIREGSSYLQNMVVVSSRTMKSILDLQPAKEVYSNILSLLVKTVKDNHRNFELVYAICGLFANVSLSLKGKTMLSKLGAGPILHKVMKNAKDDDLARTAMNALSNLISKNRLLKNMMVEDSIISTVVSILKSSTQSITLAACFGLLKNLCDATESTAQMVGDSDVVLIAMNTIQVYSEIPDIVASAFSFLRTVVTIENNQWHYLELAKKVLSAMKDNPNDDRVQSDGCHLLAELPKSRALKSLFHTKSTEMILVAAAKEFPDLCRTAIDGIIFQE